MVRNWCGWLGVAGVPSPPCAPFIYGPAIAVESVLSPPHQPKPPFFKG